MYIIKVADEKQVESIVSLARNIWYEYFTPIIGKAQVDYMLDKFQSQESITRQIQHDTIYFLMIENSEAIGYAAIILKETELFLSKFYLLSTQRNKGFGRQSLNFFEQLAQGQNKQKISLTVHKHNLNSIEAYKKMGFSKLGPIVQDIGGGFIMDDDKMEKIL